MDATVIHTQEADGANRPVSESNPLPVVMVSQAGFDLLLVG